MKGRIATALLGLVAAACQAQDFSADIAYDPAKTQDGSSGSVPPVASSKAVREQG
ncbi:MAG TPA: hypothetical protein VEV41_08880 [Terriglobales bacterium]|nr:hypothetical protein [Terriglobales bacterium]